MKFTHEYDANGNHRLVVTDTDSVFPSPHNQHVGAWATYQSLAVVTTFRAAYFVATDYWNPTFTTDTVYHYAPITIAPTAEVSRA